MFLVLSMTGTAAEQSSTLNVLEHHFASINKGDLDAILSDYADEAVMITPGGPVKGNTAIRGVYGRMTKDGTTGVEMKVVTRFTEGNVAYAVWTQNNGAQKSAATLMIRDGKIIAQTIVTGLIPG